MKKTKKIYRDALKSMDSVMSRKSIERSEHKAQKEILQIRLAELRKLQKLTQSQVKGFSQVDISRLENRDDMKLSTLIKYVRGLGADIEIKARLKDVDEGEEEEITLIRAVGE